MAALKYNLKILSCAQKELEEIAKLHMELVGVNSARTITNMIYDSLERLQSFPRCGGVPKDTYLQKLEYRYIICGKYVCFYKFTEETILVYHIVHDASNYPTLLKNSDVY